MLRISSGQVEVFRTRTRARFEETMMERCAVLAPARCAELGPAPLRTAVQAAIGRAELHGFTWVGPVRLFVELCLLLGSGFDTDVQYPFARACLHEPGPQMQRAAALHAGSVAALHAMRGPEGRHDEAALWRLRELVAARPAAPRERDLTGVALATLAHVHPQRYAWIGEPALRSLIEHAEGEAMWHGIAGPESVLLIAGLMFAFGHACLEDPFHPWLAASLDREHHPDRALVGEQLRRHALARLGVVLRDREPAT